MSSRYVDLSKYRDLDIRGITMRSVNGNDTLDASARCIPPDGGGLDGNIFVLLLRQQLLAQSIESYVTLEGKTVTKTGSACLESIEWSGRTREFVGEIFDHINGVRADEREDFRKALMSTPGSGDTVSAK